MPNRKKLTKKLIRKIKDLIESGETNITTICSLSGISRRVWYKWEADQSAQFTAAISRARARAREREDEKLVCSSKRSLLLLLQGMYLMKTEDKIEFRKDGGQDRTVTISSTHVPPCTQTIIFVLENLDKPNFSSRLRRHAKAQFGHFSNFASKSGAKILTMDEALEIGLIDSPGKMPTEDPEISNSHYSVRNMK